MDASVLVVVTYPVQLLVKSLIQHCQHHWSLVPKRRRDNESYKELEDVDATMLEVFGDYDIQSVSEISDNDSLSSVDMDDACV